ncbi:MAG: hypothetical protein AAFS07_19500, partial [Pseudomonadota bacterium]
MHAVPREYQACVAFTQHFKRGLRYYGESPGVLMNTAFDILCKPAPREQLEPEVRHEILETQGYACALCGNDELLQVDHKVPLRLGGANS